MDLSKLRYFRFPAPRPTRPVPTKAELARLDERTRARLHAQGATGARVSAAVRQARAARARQSWAFRTHVLRWQDKMALRILGLCQMQGCPTPTRDALAEEIARMTRQRGKEWIVDDWGGSSSVGHNRIGSSGIDDLAAQAAEYALDVFDPRIREWARKGGRKSRTPQRFTLAEFEKVAGLSKAEQARQLGCSTSTVANLRREYAAAHREERELAELLGADDTLATSTRVRNGLDDLDDLLGD